MTIKLPYPYQKKTIVLVLPHTFFLDGFRHYRTEDSITHLENLAKITLIAEYIIRKRAFEPTTKVGATSERAFKEFENKVGDVSSFSRLNLILFREALSIDTDERLNKLKYPESTVIAVADKQLKISNRNPIIVVRGDSVEKWEKDYIKDFYKKSGKSKKKILAVLSVDNSLTYIREKDRKMYDSARDSISDSQLQYYLPK